MREKHRYVAILFMALCQAQCSGEPPRTPAVSIAEDAGSPPPMPPPAEEVRDSILRWAGDEPVAIIHEGGKVVARALDSGRSKVLRAEGANKVLLDTALDLIWIQGLTTLDAIDLRLPEGAPVLIAKGLPEGMTIRIVRTTEDGKTTYLEAPEVCEQVALMSLEWNRTPRLSLVVAEREDQRRAAASATLVGESWLREQIGRPAGAFSTARREFLPAGGSGAPSSPVPSRRLKCAGTPFCGAAIPFDGTGRLLVLTDHDEADCQHYGCRIWDPATKEISSPPGGTSSGAPSDAPGPCGLYHFDRSGKRFLIGNKVCVVGGACQDLGGQAIGWLSGGTDVGTNG